MMMTDMDSTVAEELNFANKYVVAIIIGISQEGGPFSFLSRRSVSAATISHIETTYNTGTGS